MFGRIIDDWAAYRKARGLPRGEPSPGDIVHAYNVGVRAGEF